MAPILGGESDLLNLVARGAGLVIGIQIASFAIRYVSQLGLAWWMGASNYGAFVYAMSIGTILAIPAALGLPTVVLRFIPQYRENRQWSLLRGIVLRSWSLVLGTGLGLAAIAAGVLWLLATFGQVEHTTALLLGIGLVPLLALMSLQLQIARSTEQMVLAYAPSYLLRHALLLGGVGLAYVLNGDDVSSVTALAITGAALTTILFSQAAVWLCGVPEHVHNAVATYKTKKWLRVAWPLLLVASFNILLDQTDVFLLGVLRPPEEAGVYNIALKTSVLVTFVLTGVNAIAAPRISKLYDKGEIEKLQRLVSMVAHLSFWPSVLGSVVLIAIAEPFLSLFGDEFVTAKDAMIILILGRLTNAGAGAVGYLMNLTGHQKESSRVFAWSAIVNIVLNLGFIPLFGIEGAAIASATTMMLWNVWLHVLVSKRVGVTSSVIGLFLRSKSP